MGDMTTKTAAIQHFTVHHDGVTIPVSRGGRGRPLVFCPGLTSTQAELSELLDLLRRDFEVVSFDLRGHGFSAPADRYSFETFLGDFGAVLIELRRRGLSAPILAGHSLGADLVLRYAAAHPDAAAELVLVDGANPIPEPFITEADLPEFRALWEGLMPWYASGRGTARQILLTAPVILELNRELDRIRPGMLDRYREIDCPITMIMATAMAGHSGQGRTPRHNRLWRAGVERLLRERPGIVLSWLDATHALVVTHAGEVARRIRCAAGPAGRAQA